MDSESNLVKKYTPLVKKAAAKYVLKYGIEWDDLIQEGYLALIIAARKFEPERGVPLGAYLKSQIFQSLWTYCRRSLSKKEVVWADDWLTGFFAQETSEKEENLFWKEILGLLPEKQRKAIYYLYFADLNLKETGTMMGISPQAVFRLKRRALINLEQLFTKEVE